MEEPEMNLMLWNQSRLIGLVFDTTATNSGINTGACRRFEVYLEQAFLYLACRHHIPELHLSHLFKYFTGETTDPGMTLFRRYRSAYMSLDMDSTKFHTLDLSSLPDWMAEEATRVLQWVLASLYADTRPRADYKACLLLLIYVLGGDLKNFNGFIPSHLS